MEIVPWRIACSVRLLNAIFWSGTCCERGDCRSCRSHFPKCHVQDSLNHGDYSIHGHTMLFLNLAHFVERSCKAPEIRNSSGKWTAKAQRLSYWLYWVRAISRAYVLHWVLEMEFCKHFLRFVSPSIFFALSAWEGILQTLLDARFPKHMFGTKSLRCKRFWRAVSQV